MAGSTLSWPHRTAGAKPWQRPWSVHLQIRRYHSPLLVVAGSHSQGDVGHRGRARHRRLHHHGGVSGDGAGAATAPGHHPAGPARSAGLVPAVLVERSWLCGAGCPLCSTNSQQVRPLGTAGGGRPASGLLRYGSFGCFARSNTAGPSSLSTCLHHDSIPGPGAKALVYGRFAIQRMALDICGQARTPALHGQPARPTTVLLRAAMQAPSQMPPPPPEPSGSGNKLPHCAGSQAVPVMGQHIMGQHIACHRSQT